MRQAWSYLFRVLVFRCSAGFFCAFLLISCSPGNDPAGPLPATRYEYTLAVTAGHPDSLIIALTAHGAASVRRFILPYHFADNPLDTFAGPLARDISVSDSQGMAIPWSIDSHWVGPVYAGVVEVPETVQPPFHIRYRVDLKAIDRLVPRSYVPRVFFDGSRGFLAGPYLFALPEISTDPVRLWRTPLDIRLRVMLPEKMSLAGVEQTAGYRNTYALLFIQALLGIEPVHRHSGGVQPFSLYNLTGTDLNPEYLGWTSGALEAIFSDIVPRFGHFGVRDYAVTFIDFGGGALEGTHGFLTDALGTGPNGDLGMVMAHEAYHHFVGIRCGDRQDPWWKEATATYLGWTASARLGLASKDRARSWLVRPIYLPPEQAGYRLSSPEVRTDLFPRDLVELVYGRGSQVVMLMDRQVRANTANTRSLEDVVARLTSDFDGRAFYRSDLVERFRSIGRTDITGLLATYVDSTAEIDTALLSAAFAFLDSAGALGR